MLHYGWVCMFITFVYTLFCFEAVSSIHLLFHILIFIFVPALSLLVWKSIDYLKILIIMMAHKLDKHNGSVTEDQTTEEEVLPYQVSPSINDLKHQVLNMDIPYADKKVFLKIVQDLYKSK